MTIIEQKKQLRKAIKEQKKTFSGKDKTDQSNYIFKKIENLPAFTKASNVLLYWSMNDEVSTHKFVQKWCKFKTILLPVVDGDTLKIKKFEGISSMIKGEQFGIFEPGGENYTDWDKIEIIIVPGVAFDKSNNRMGRGRGYYDKLLKNAKAMKIGVCFNFQYFDVIPVEEHDLPMDLVIKA